MSAENIIRALTSALEKLAAVTVILLAIFVTGNVFTRFAFKVSVPDVDAFAGFLLLAIVFLPLGMVSFREEQLRVLVFYDRVQGKAKRYLTAFIEIVFLTFVALLLIGTIYYSVRAFLERTMKPGMLDIPIAWPSLIIPLGLFCLFLTSLVMTIRRRKT